MTFVAASAFFRRSPAVWTGSARPRHRFGFCKGRTMAPIFGRRLWVDHVPKPSDNSADSGKPEYRLATLTVRRAPPITAIPGTQQASKTRARRVRRRLCVRRQRAAALRRPRTPPDVRCWPTCGSARSNACQRTAAQKHRIVDHHGPHSPGRRLVVSPRRGLSSRVRTAPNPILEVNPNREWAESLDLSRSRGGSPDLSALYSHFGSASI